ncbi:hypothetical protein Pelo_5025 [Pelomyxa schiedti]|nr:hypothetical protein Pelo_5025 [Pelomyxa schiedti]
MTMAVQFLNSHLQTCRFRAQRDTRLLLTASKMRECTFDPESDQCGYATNYLWDFRTSPCVLRRLNTLSGSIRRSYSSFSYTTQQPPKSLATRRVCSDQVLNCCF